ncbi:MAG: pyridoxamine 5'-phosphate oxidase family protein [Nitrosopumilus sp. H13]|nr:MAG: pyridoxamine 5'-phosphate oxidase family protein [Nitrosopumilus sp. H13]
MRSHAKIAEFAGGYPQVIPMNFVFLEGVIYMHSHTRGEKLDNIMRNAKVGFEVDRELEFLPSYFEDLADASLADTLYISVVVKGTGSVVSDRGEKTRALNGLMAKYQPEGRYEPVSEDMRVLDAVSVIKVEPSSMRGKYKIGQHLSPDDRMALAEKILARGSQSAERTLEVMGFGIRNGKPEMLDEPVW